MLTMWMQAVLGGFLLIGLCTRMSSLVLAGFLLQVVMLTPALAVGVAAAGDRRPLHVCRYARH